jgi:hypothetical protein
MSTKITAELLAELLEKQSQSLLEAVAKLLKEHSAAAPAVAPKKAKKSKKSSDSADSSEPKPKREANDWIKFSQRVEQLVRATEEAAETPKEQKMRTTVVKQFASHLKTLKAYAEWDDSDIQTALAEWTPPETSKRETKRKDSASSAASAASKEKPKRKWSDEAKAAAAAKRAAKKAAAAAASVADSDDESEAEKKPVAKPVAPSAEKPKKVIKPKVAEKPKVSDSRFHKWTHAGTDYWKNARGDVVSEEMDWVGHWDGKKIDESAKQPEDLAEAEFDEE